MTSARSAAPPTAPPDRLTPGARKALVASMVGTLIEWYDYALYGAAAGLIIGPLFFPQQPLGRGRPGRLRDLRRRLPLPPPRRADHRPHR